MRNESVSRRRRALLGASIALFVIPVPRLARAAASQKASLLARRVERVPEDPSDAAWGEADVLDVPLAPQAVVKPRAYETGVKSVSVRALYSQERVALCMEWRDGARDGMAGQAEAFRDAVAVAFPADPRAGGIPYFGMGEPERPVTIYQWKADWQAGPMTDVDERYPDMAVDWYPLAGREPGAIVETADYGKQDGAKAFVTSWGAGSPLADPQVQAGTPVEKLVARGFGTLTSVDRPQQDGAGKAAWKDGVWRACISFPRAQEQFTFEQGMTLPVAFAAWDGASRERGGEKGVSTWYFLSLERPVGTVAYAAPLAVAAGVAGLQAWGLRLLRRKAKDAGPGGPGS
ncbi:MAG: ethylbenzene dehydrogenase-related protein [Gammaproteobacteria bacterium]